MLQALPGGNRRSVGLVSSSSKPRRAAALAALSAAVLAGIATSSSMTRAADMSWDGGGANDLWSNGLNWGTNLAPQPLDNLFFDGAIRTTPSNDFAADTVFGKITFNPSASSFTLGGNGTFWARH